MFSKAYKFVKGIIRDFMADDITVFSAQASFYISISSFPFIMLLISLVGFIIPDYKPTILSAVQAIIPQTILPTIQIIISELFEKSISIVSVSAATALWSASRGIAAVERGIRRIYKVAEPESFIKSVIISMLYTVIFIGILALTLIVHVFGNFIIDILNNYIPLLEQEVITIKGILVIVVLVLIFQIMYYLFSKRKIPFTRHFYGAVFTAACWMIFSKIYTIYIEHFTNFSYIYGSLTAIVLMMLWVYSCLIILLSGAELNKIIYSFRKNTK